MRNKVLGKSKALRRRKFQVERHTIEKARFCLVEAKGHREEPYNNYDNINQ